jgi:uncharacterized phage protein (predicted DNA packaging)
MVTLAEAKLHVHVDFDEDDDAIQKMIDAAMDHLSSIDIDVAVTPLPPALHHAILLLVALYYDNREAITDGAERPLPFGVSRLIAPYREVSL